MPCPRCDQQGTVHKVRIIETGEVVHVCDECDALRPSGVEVGRTGFHDFSSYVAPFGLQGIWQEVALLD